jgi:hypothetical protein
MQYANIMLALGGDRGTVVPKTEVSASEIAVLRLLHGQDAVFDVEPLKVDEDLAKRTSRQEIQRLTELYGRARVQGPDGNDVSVINILFPGAAAQAIKELDDLDIPHEFFKAKSRVTIEEVAEDEADDGLSKLTKAELLEEAEKRGIEVDASAKKAEILDAIRAGGDKTEDEVFA